MRTWPALDVIFNDPASDELLQAALLDFQVAAIEESTITSWRVFFHAAEERERAAATLKRQFPDLALVPVDVPDEDWAARSQANLRAIEIANIVVAPPWDAPSPHGGSADNDSRLTVIIQPSMGFGTGHHATTRLCLRALQKLDLAGKSVLDVGTGSGVLAIAASLLGAPRVVGIDDDPDAVQSARENVDLNPGARVDLRITDLRAMPEERFDVILANLTGALLVHTAAQLLALLAPAGTMVLSGFMKVENAAVRAAFSQLQVIDHAEEDEWECVTVAQA